MESSARTKAGREGSGPGDGRRSRAVVQWAPSPPEPIGAPTPRIVQSDAIPRRRSQDVRSPADGAVLGSVPITNHVQVLQAVERARSVQRGWIALRGEERFAVLKSLIELVGSRTDEIVEIIRRETGKPEIEALGEILATVELFDYYLEVAPRVLRREWMSTGWLMGKSAYTYREPYGVVGVITSWNYPFLLIADVVAAALFTGNAVIVKPSESTPFSALALRDLCLEAGLTPGLMEVVTGDDTTGQALVESGVDKIVFIGSTPTGRKVMAAAAQNLTPVSLELSGKDPAIVLEDADLDRAAHGIVYGAFYNAGQSCIATERVFVVDAVYDAFVERVTEVAKELRAGAEGEYDVGPIISERQLRVVEAHLEDALARGARVTVGGGRLAPNSNVFLPTVLVDVDQSMRVVWEETFGPILPLMRVKNEEEAVRLSNVSPYGLYASIWTEDRERGEALGEQLRAGGVSINDTLSHYAVPGLPIGGVGASGFGRRRGVAGLEEMSRPRSVLVHRTGLARELWWFPYTERSTRLMRALLGYRHSSAVGHVVNVARRIMARRFLRGLHS